MILQHYNINLKINGENKNENKKNKKMASIHPVNIQSTTSIQPQPGTLAHDIQTFKKHNFYKIIKYIRHKYPGFLLFIHICFSKYIIMCNQIFTSDYNTTNVIVDYKVDSHVHNIHFWLYIISISLICFTWEFLYKFFRYKRKKILTKKNIIHSIVSSFLSVFVLLSTMFYKDNYNVFNCFINWNDVTATTFFFISYLCLIIYSLFEHYCKISQST